MAAISITGSIQDASGAGVENVVLRLAPSPESVGASEAFSGIGVLSDPVETLTAADGSFTVTAVQGYRYNLSIPSVGYDRQFIAPAQAAIRFDLLGFRPFVEAVPHGKDGGDVLRVYITVRVDSVQSVRQRFNQIVVEVSDTLDGVYAQVTTIELLPYTTFYEHTDSPASTAKFYRARYLNSGNADSSLASEPQSVVDTDEEALLLSVDELKALYLYGADLTKDDGEQFPTRMFEHYIKAGADWLSKELDIPILPVNITNETHDHFATDYGHWGYFQLQQYPVLSLTSVKFQYPSMDAAVTINSQWVVLTEGGQSGVVQIVPGQGGIADVLLIPGALMPLWSGRTGRVPGIWRFDYRAGFEIATLPPDLKHVLGMWASIGVLNIAGDLIAGAGIATKSVSMAGLSQNIGTTSSATNSGYGARIIEYQKEIKEMLPNLRRFYGKATKMVVV